LERNDQLWTRQHSRRRLFATRNERLQFHLLHEKDQGRIYNVRVCQICGKEIPYDDLVKGYEFEKDEYVMLTDADFDKAAAETSRNISITDFVDVNEIDPMSLRLRIIWSRERTPIIRMRFCAKL